MLNTVVPAKEAAWFSFEHDSHAFEIWMREPKDAIQTWIAKKRGFYDGDLLERIRCMLPAWPRVVDVGANIGNHALFFARVCGAREVIVFEPNPDVIPELRANLERNGCANVTFDHLGIGLGAAQGTASLRIDSQDLRALNRGGARLQVGTGPIRVERLDTLVFGEVDLIKIDVGGMALQVLEGCERLIRHSRPDVVIDVSLDEMPGLCDWLARTGYRVSLAHTDNLRLISMVLQPRRAFFGLAGRLTWRRWRGGRAAPASTALAVTKSTAGSAKRACRT